MTPDVGADVVFNLERCGNGERLPFEDGSFDCILGSHVFEHIVHLVDVVNELYRVLRPGGYLLSVTPYVSSDDAWDSPHHVRAFSENTWHYFTKQLYERTTLEHAGFGATQGQTYQSWEVVVNHFIPYPDLAHHDQARLDFMKRHWRNVIQELHVVLRKPEAV
jgi:ubiquinone/menaquinone biosynthesis C-methylase UbiE